MSKACEYYLTFFAIWPGIFTFLTPGTNMEWALRRELYQAQCFCLSLHNHLSITLTLFA